MIGGRIWRFKGRPWSRKSPSATIRYTRVTTDAWLGSLDNPKHKQIEVGPCLANPILGCSVMFVGLIVGGILLGTLIFIASI
jgi:hypothetical protein